jgi:hypothetical protein
MNSNTRANNLLNKSKSKKKLIMGKPDNNGMAKEKVMMTRHQQLMKLLREAIKLSQER